VHPLANADVTAPASRHNLHVTDRSDLDDVDGWSQDELYRAVTAAAEDDDLVVVDYGRSLLYLADRSDLTYRPPRVLGLGAEPALHVAAPTRYDPAASETRPLDDRVVSPTFDILVPAFDWTELSETDLLPPRYSRSESPSGHGEGTPG
jgi:hypothetical protein